MVLSNKKLKQKLREKLAESLLTSIAGKHSNVVDHSVIPNSESQPQSLKNLLNRHGPRLSKREKRRNLLPLNEEKKENESQNLEVIKKEKKRKRDEEGGIKKNTVDDGLGENDENVENLKKKNKKKKKKKKKKNKNKNKKAKNGEEDDKEKEMEMEMEKEVDEVAVFEETNGNDNLGSQVHEIVAAKVYVGGIPYYSTEDDICSFFESCGTITEVDCMKFPESGKFRGIAILSFKTEAAAKRALAMDGADMGGFFLKVQPYKATRTYKAVDFSPGIVEGYNRIYLGNLSWDITEDDVKKLFSNCKIASIRFGMDKETEEFRGYAHVDFSDSISLKIALKLDQEMVHNRPVKIRCAVPKKGIEIGKVTDSEPVPVIKEADIGLSSVSGKEADFGLSSVSGKEADNGLSSVSGKIRRRTCYECGEKGHLSSNCPKKQAADSLAS